MLIGIMFMQTYDEFGQQRSWKSSFPFYYGFIFGQCNFQFMASKEGFRFITDLLLIFILFLFHGEYRKFILKKRNTSEDFISNSYRLNK